MIWSWLSKIDPNTVIAIVTTVGAWAWHKVGGEKKKTIEQIVGGAVRAILSEVAEHVPSQVPIETWLAGARRYVNERIWTALAKVKITKTPTLEKMVSAALEQATQELAHRLAEERRRKQV